MSDATTASTWQLNSQLLEHLRVASVHFFSLLWVTLLPAPPHTGLWHHFDSLCICLFLSGLWWTKNLKLKPVLGQSLNNVDINQSKQESNVQTSSVLMRVLHSSLSMFSGRGWFMAGAAVLRSPQRQQSSGILNGLCKAPALGGGHPAASQPSPWGASSWGSGKPLTLPYTPGLWGSKGEQLSGISVEDTAVSQTVI